MEIANPKTAFSWSGPLNINETWMAGIPEKQGHSFSRHGYLQARKYGGDADQIGAAVRRALRPLSLPNREKVVAEYDRREVIDFPRAFIIEPVSICNKRCPFCPISVLERYDENGEKVAPGYMRWNDFAKLMDECREHEVHGISLYQLGESMFWREPLLTIVDMIDYASECGFSTVNLSTNADVDNLDILLGTKLSDLLISLDGTTSEVYLQNRPSAKKNDPGAFERTVERIKVFLEKKARSGKPEPFVRMQIVNTQSAAPQVHDFIKTWIEIDGVDDVFVKNLDSMAPWLGDSVVPKDEAEIKMSKVSMMPCMHLFGVGSMTSSGQLNACCHDSKSELTERGVNGKFANIRTTTFAEWWKGEFMSKLRAEHVGGVFRLPCSLCAERDVW